jgi:hypothetical protein
MVMMMIDDDDDDGGGGVESYWGVEVVNVIFSNGHLRTAKLPV